MPKPRLFFSSLLVFARAFHSFAQGGNTFTGTLMHAHTEIHDKTAKRKTRPHAALPPLFAVILDASLSVLPLSLRLK